MMMSETAKYQVLSFNKIKGGRCMHDGRIVHDSDGVLFCCLCGCSLIEEVTAVNAFEPMKEALQSALNMVDGDGTPPDWDQLRAVLRLAEGEKE
jgi:hypothetical protein